MKALKFLVKALLFPVYLILHLVSFVVVLLGQFAVMALRFLGGLYVLGIVSIVIYGIWKNDMAWSFLIQAIIVGAVIFILRYLVENAPGGLAGIANKLMSW